MINSTQTFGTLYVVATPIGNLADMTYRAVSVLKEVDVVLCEDTRTSQILFSHYAITTKKISYHAHSSLHKHDYILNDLQNGKNIALVCDAGTPGISDPGSLLISHIRETEPTIPVIPIPGASALISLLSVSGYTGNQFTFLGFAPHKKGRETFFKEIETFKHSVVFYESCHRVTKTLKTLLQLYDVTHTIGIGREMTKKFETYLFNTIHEAEKVVTKNKIQQKGEFVIMLIPRKKI